MTKRLIDADTILNQAKPLTHQHAHEIQPFGHPVKLPIALAEKVCSESVDNLTQLLADVSIAMAHDVAETTLIPRPPKGREEVPVQISRLLHAHAIVLKEARTMARRAAEVGDDGTNDLLVSDVIRSNELQVWFVAEHVVDVPLT